MKCQKCSEKEAHYIKLERFFAMQNTEWQVRKQTSVQSNKQESFTDRVIYGLPK